jgi:Raf kinase inhibitor-like YbhB/YbcL family protein
LCIALIAVVASADTGERQTMKIASPAFTGGAAIPRRFTSEGPDVSPELRCDAVPPAAKALAIIVDDPDAPRPEPWVHWVIFNLPADLKALPEGVAKDAKPAQPAGAIQGRNTWGTVGYRGPEPPKGHGVHHYHFKLYALDAMLDPKPGLDKDGLLAAMRGHIVAEAELVGTYERK